MNRPARTTRNLTFRYLFALGVLAALALVNYMVFRTEIRESSAAARVLNTSGRQRMLVQRAALLAHELVTAADRSQQQALRQKLNDAIRGLERSHHRLVEFDAPAGGSADRRQSDRSPAGEQDDVEETQSTIRSIYFDAPWLLDTEVRNYVAQLQALLRSAPEELSLDNSHLKFIRDVAVSNRVTDGLDRVVAAYQRQSEAKTARLRRLAYWSFLSTFVVLGLTGLVVFRPMVQQVRADMTALHELNETLEQRVAERTELAERRARELELSEAALRSHTRILRSILDSMGDGVVVADAENQFQLLNPEARRILNIPPAAPRPDLNAQNWTEPYGVELLLPDESAPYPFPQQPLSRAMRGESVDRAEMVLRRKNAPASAWLSVTARPVIDDDQKVHGGVAVLRDITQRKRAEQELKDSEALYHSLVDNLPVCVIRKDQDGRFEFANELFCQLIGHSFGDLVGKTDFDFYPAELAEKYRDDDVQVIETGASIEDVEEHATPDGRCLFVEIRKTPVHDSEGTVVGTQTIFWDVTDRVMAERQREEFQTKLVQSERLAAIGQMVTGVAHESRNALQQIQACTQLLDWQTQSDAGGETGELIADIQQAHDRLHRLFEDLREYAAPLRLDRRDCRIDQVVRKAWDSVLSVGHGQEAVFEEQGNGADLRCQADPFQIEQVFRNLFENSLTACQENGAPRIETEFEETQWNGAPAVRIAVRDNGPGLSQDERARLFDPFFTTKTQGTGLGTSIAKRIIETHGGRIDVGRHLDQGTEIVILLPREAP